MHTQLTNINLNTTNEHEDKTFNNANTSVNIHSSSL